MIDFRSDTVTKPTEAMRKAAYGAVVGDDVYGEDPSVIALEEKSAEILGKEAALFVPSGTQGNQIAVLTHCSPGQEIILEAESHIFQSEGAATSAFAGVQPYTIKGQKGAMNPEEVEASIRGSDIHDPETGLICIENTHNQAGGAIVPLENMKEIYDIAQKHMVPVHLDGARLFNAVVASGIEAKTFAKYSDTVQFCLSKGLGAPVGSIIAGSNDFIKRARKWRKRLGGGLRQSGMIAAPGIVALETMINRLEEDHIHAKLLAEGISNIKELQIRNDVDTNMVLVDPTKINMSAETFVMWLEKLGILTVVFGPNIVRFTTHYHLSKEDIEKTIQIINQELN